ncbi:MAG: peptide-methionine (S)-S-oxide reductase MsrA [Lactobacillaceae bacterium]|jgi:peptide-methionine (S)-S-oxide reductase|nr:peptide-methionine (S)-S-oxide reductase MsrA [Lactobacillaceae bacterium]
MAEQTAIFAGGCFWCMVQPFEEMKGVNTVLSGYTGGHKDHPTYRDVVSHTTGHTEAVEIWFDDSQISYEDLVNLYWQTADPTDATGQFQDRGDNYRPVIFVNSEEQKKIAEKSKQELQDSQIFDDQEIVTSIEPAKTFWVAEEEHQDFYKKDPERFELEHARRKAFLDSVWKKENQL